jgi:hypothetical protein
MLLVLAACVTVTFAAENKQEVPLLEEIKLPSSDSVQYWTVRSRAMTELIPFMTKKRREMKENLQYFTDYLQANGMGEGFLVSKIEVTPTPRIHAKALGILEDLEAKGIKIPEKFLTWEETVEFSMRYIMEEGYLPVDVEGDEELAMYKKICKQKEAYGKKVQKELREVIYKGIKIWTYLGTLGKQESLRVFVFKAKENKRIANETRIRKGREGQREDQRKFRRQLELDRKRDRYYDRSHYRRYYY